MTDVLTPEQRSFNMSRIRGRNTKPEMVVRSLVHRMGFRYRLHRKDLPGKPDLVFPRLRKIVLVHGCFWHMHNCPYGRVIPRTNSEFWDNKRRGNVERDRKILSALRNGKWKVKVVWECEIKNEDNLVRMLTTFLGSKDSNEHPSSN